MSKSKSALETAMYYKEMEAINAASGMLREVKWQYSDMANGGNGGELGLPDTTVTCRSYNYPNYPDSFFQEVCAFMGWKW